MTHAAASVCFYSQITEPKNNATDTVLTADNEVADNSEITAVTDRHSESDNSTGKQLESELMTASCCDGKSSLVVANTLEMPMVKSDAAAKDVLDNCEQKDGSQIKTVDIRTESVIMNSSQGGLSRSDHQLKSCDDTGMKPNEEPCLPMSENNDVCENYGEAVTCTHTSPNMSEGQYQNVCSLSPKDLPVAELQSSKSLGSHNLPVAEAECIVDENCSTKTSVNDDHCVLVDGGSEEMAIIPSNTSVMSKSPVQQNSVTETGGCALSTSEKASVDISSVKSQCCQTDERLVDDSVITVDAQNSPVHFQTTSSISCTPVQVQTVLAKVLETAECWVQTSPNVTDSSCSPLRNAMTCSIGCSPAEVETRSARTSPMLFLATTGCSVQTEPWTMDAQCSPMVMPKCVESHMANAQTSPQQYSAKHSTASFSTDIPPSQRTADSTTPNNRKNSHCGEVFCQKLPSVVASIVGSQSSYETPTVVACSDENPRNAAVTDDLESCEDSTQPLSCEELFDNESPLSHNVSHQLTQAQASISETKNTSSDNRLVDMEDRVADNSDNSYSLECSQVSPKCSDEESNEEVKGNNA